MFKKLVKTILPNKVVQNITSFHIVLRRYFALKFGQGSNKTIKLSERIDVLFFVFHDSVWKLNSVYELFEKDERFNPIILICPCTDYGDENMVKTMEQSYQFFKSASFNVKKTYENNKWLNVNECFNNKVVFFTNPHNITKKEYQWSNFKNSLKFYVPYHHQIDGGQWDGQWKAPFHLSMTSLFYVDSFHKELSKEITMNKGTNVEVTGYPATEILYSDSYIPNDVWKTQGNKKIRIIFAPHHTIEFSEATGVNEFLNIAEELSKIALKYKDKIQIAFKPHPILKSKLYRHSDWGKDKTDEYYLLWRNGENTQLEEGQYSDLFLTSDAMIHDSGSFLAEYLYVNKPVMYLYNTTTKSRFNEYGKDCLECCYLDENNDVDKFIHLLLSGIDNESVIRERFIRNRLVFDKSNMPSIKIYGSVCKRIFN